MAGLVPGRVLEICQEVFEDPREEELDQLLRRLAVLEAEHEGLEAEVPGADCRTRSEEPSCSSCATSSKTSKKSWCWSKKTSKPGTSSSKRARSSRRTPSWLSSRPSETPSARPSSSKTPPERSRKKTPRSRERSAGLEQVAEASAEQQGLLKDNRELADLAGRQARQVQSLEAAVHSLQREAEKCKLENASLAAKVRDLSLERDGLRKENQQLAKLSIEEKSANDKQVLGLERSHDKSLHELQRKADGLELDNERLREKLRSLEEEKRGLAETHKEQLLAEGLRKQAELKEMAARMNKQLSEKHSESSWQAQRQKEEAENRSLWEFDDLSSAEPPAKSRANLDLFEAKSKFLSELRDLEKKYAAQLDSQLQAAVAQLRREYEATIGALTKQLEDLLAESKEKSKSLSDLKQKYSSLEEASEALSTDCGKLRVEVDHYKSKNAQLRDLHELLEEKVAVAQKEIAVLKSDSLAQLNTVKLKEDSLARLKEDFAKLQSIASETRKREIDEESLVRAKVQEVEDLKSRLAATAAAAADLSSDKLRLEQESSALKTQLHNLQMGFSEERERYEAAVKEKVEQLKSRVPESEVDSKVQILQDSHRRELAELESKHRRAVGELERSLSGQFHSTLSHTNSSHEKATQKALKQLMSLETQAARLKTELSKVRSDGLLELKAAKEWARSACGSLLEELHQSRQFRDSQFEAYYSKLEAEFKDTTSKLFKSERALAEKEEELAEAREGTAD